MQGASRLRISYIILGILCVAAVLRFPHIATVPAWYTDEGMYAHNAWEFIHGNISTFGITDWTFVSPFSTTPPLYHAIAGTLMALFGKSVIVLRIFSACVGVATVWSLFWVGKYLFKNPWAGILPASLFAIIPQFVVNTRWSFPQSLMGLLLLWALYWMWRYRESGRFSFGVYGALCAALASSLSFWPWFFAIPIMVIAWRAGKKRAVTLSLLSVSLPIVLIGIRAAMVPFAFGKDVSAIFHGFFAANRETSGHDILLGLQDFFTRNALITLSFVGLLCARDRMLRFTLLISVIALAIPVMLLRFDFKNYFYPAMIFAPLLLLGGWGIVQLLKTLTKDRPTFFITFAGVAICVYLCALSIVEATQITRGTITQGVSTHAFIVRDDVHYMKSVAAYLNPKLQPTDYVIAPNNLSWQLHARTSDKVWTACYEYQNQYENLWQQRFLYPQGITDASFIVEDTLFTGGDVSGCFDFHDAITQKISDVNWPVVYRDERFVIRHNPKNP